MEEKNINNFNLRDAKATAAIFSSTVAITIASVYHLSRIGFNNPTWPVLTTLSLSFFLLFLPQGCHSLLQRFQLNFQQSWLSTDAIISLLGLIILTLSGLIEPLLGLNILPAFFLIGLLLFVVNFISFFKSGTLKENVIFITITGAFSVWVASATISYYWHDSLLKEKLIVGNEIFADLLFQASMSNMIKTYGVPSTGLDGVPYFPYHFGSHWIFAQLSNLLSLDLIKFYQLGFPVIFIPFLFNRLLSFSIDIKQYIKDSVNFKNLRTDYKYWGLFYVVYINCIPSAMLKQQINPPWNAYPILFNSESYTVGLSLSFILLSVTLFITSQNLTEKIICLRTPEIIFFTAIFPLILGLIGLSKISCVFVVLAVYIYLFVRLSLYRYTVFNLMIVLSISVFSSIYLAYTYNKSESSTLLEFFGFITENVQEGWKPFFFFINFFWSWVFIILKLYEKNIKTLGDLRVAYISNSLLDVEIIFIVCVAGIAPGIFFNLIAGASFYFSDIQTWISLSFILANLQNFTRVIRRILG